MPGIRLIDIHGIEGIGKTRLAFETAQYLNEREIFKDGIFYIDLKNVKTTQEFKDKANEIIMQSANIENKNDLVSKLEENNMLLIMDNVNDIINNKAQFDWNVITLINIYKNIKIILLTQSEIKIEDFESIKDKIISIEVPPLDDDEAADMVINNCEIDLAAELLSVKQRDPKNNCHSTKEYIMSNRNLANCCGVPMYLQKFINALNKERLENIEIKKVFKSKTEFSQIQ